MSNSHEYGDMTSPDDLSSIDITSEIALKDFSPIVSSPNKRVFFGESYGQQSMETIFKKMNHAVMYRRNYHIMTLVDIIYIAPVVLIGNQVILPGKLLHTLLTPRTLVRSASVPYTCRIIYSSII
jgi:hypothetical protein